MGTFNSLADVMAQQHHYSFANENVHSIDVFGANQAQAQAQFARGEGQGPFK